MRLRNISLLVLVLLAFTSPSWAIGIAGSAGGKRVTVSVDGTWRGTYVAGTPYVVGDIVTDGTTNYRSFQNSNTGHTPASSPLYWQAILTKGDAGPTGATGSQGPTGTAGADGKTVLTTSGAPASGTGVNGDYAYDPATYTMYGPKAAGAWPAGTIIKGADGAGFTSGADGTYGWLTDSNTSSYTECASGKYGLNFVGGVLYQCSNGTNSVFTSGDSLPSQTGNSGKYLTTNGTTASWGSIAAGSGIAISADIPTDTGAANLNDTTHVLTVASTTGYTQFTGSFTAWDTTPSAFSFTDETDVAADGGQSCGAAITVAGINYPAAISVTGDTGHGYKINGGTFTNASGTVALNDTVAPCVNRSTSNSTATTATITIGGVSDTYSVTTVTAGAYVAKKTFDYVAGTANRETLGMDTNSYRVKNKYTAGSNFSLTRVKIYPYKIGSPTFNVSMSVLADAAGSPSDTVLASSTTTISASSLGTSEGVGVDFDFAGLALSNGTVYWITVTVDGHVDASNRVVVQKNSAASGDTYYLSGVSGVGSAATNAHIGMILYATE